MIVPGNQSKASKQIFYFTANLKCFGKYDYDIVAQKLNGNKKYLLQPLVNLEHAYKCVGVGLELNSLEEEGK